MKTIYVTSQCCSSRKAVFSSPEVRKNGDYERWNYGIRETKAIANWDHPVVKSRGAGLDVYITRTARAVIDLIGID